MSVTGIPVMQSSLSFFPVAALTAFARHRPNHGCMTPGPNPRSIFFPLRRSPLSRTTSGTDNFNVFAVDIPCAMMSHFMIPPKY
jgi:hypothetical protein